MNKLKQNLHRVLSAILAVSMLASCGSTAFAAQQNSYHDPAEHWLESASRMNELDGNAIVTHETMACGECLRETMFTCFRTPEYSRTGESALNRNVRYSDGTMFSGTSKGNVDAGIPKKGGFYTGHHWSKAVCDACGTVNSNMNKETDYGYGKMYIGYMIVQQHLCRNCRKKLLMSMQTANIIRKRPKQVIIAGSVMGRIRRNCLSWNVMIWRKK